MLMKKKKIGIYITRNAIKLLNDIISEKGDGKIKEGGSQITAGRMQEGGGAFRCVLCATSGVGGSKNQEKMRM